MKEVKATKAIIAVAGYGTRRLPVAKAVEKCMLPLLNRPVLDYIVRDLVGAGVANIFFVVSGDARQIREYYRRNVELEEYLIQNGKASLVDEILPPKGVRFHFVEQDRTHAYGTAIPAWLCHDYVTEDESFFLVMGDQILWRTDGQSEANLLLQQVDQSGADGGLVGVEVPETELEKYGIIDMDDQQFFKNIIEKPRYEDAPSNLNNASLYLLPGTFMKNVDELVATPRDGEYYLTDAVNSFVADGKNLVVRRSDAAYLDCGTVEGWVAANQFLLDNQI
jgi:UTP--glucose-1-phosphate uridylyltransferase